MDPHVALLEFIRKYASHRIETCNEHGSDDYSQGNVEIGTLISCLDGRRFNIEEYRAFASLVVRYGKQTMLDATGRTVFSALYRVEAVSTDPTILEWRMAQPI
jgi:hypothetical protein